jgi:hypothetical protein
MDPSERGDERRLSVVDVSRGADDTNAWLNSSFFRALPVLRTPACGLAYHLLHLGFVMSHNAFVGGQPILGEVHQLLQLLLGDIRGLL